MSFNCRVRASALLLCWLTLICELPAVTAQVKPPEIKSLYTKYEYRIPMRDGRRLFTVVYLPRDESTLYPILLNRTPYGSGPYGVDQYRNEIGPSSLMSQDGYIFVYQDVRGRWMSEGELVNMRPHRPRKTGSEEIDESSDTFDTIDWLLRNIPNHNGRVGMWGVSYPGFYTTCGVIDAHPALVCASPQAPIADWFAGDDWHHNGALMLPHSFHFMSKFGHARPEPTKKFDHNLNIQFADGYQFFLDLGSVLKVNQSYFRDRIGFWNEMMVHDTYDEFWKSRNIRPHLKNIRPAVLTVGGWFDAENLFGALETYKSIETQSPGTNNRLVMGPWWHGQWTRDAGANLGNVPFHSATSEFYREKIEKPFFDHHLKGRASTKEFPEAWVFETGTNRWREFQQWPPVGAKPQELTFEANGRLKIGSGRLEAGHAAELGKAVGDREGSRSRESGQFDEFISDPRKPVPFIDWTDPGMPKEYMTADQRFASRRPDVVVYRSEILGEDLRLAGPVEVDLTVSTSAADCDWIVKLIDVYPDDFPDPPENPRGVRMAGYQQLVRGDVMRGRFRNSLEKPEPFEPDVPTSIRFRLPDVCHCFRSGHRVMVQVQSTWFPLVDRNPQTFVDIDEARPEDFQKAVQRVYRDSLRPSRLIVGAIP
jgi:putative CocE/NonD family hydrolase